MTGDQRRYDEVLGDLNVAERALYDATNGYRDFRDGTLHPSAAVKLRWMERLWVLVMGCEVESRTEAV